MKKEGIPCHCIRRLLKERLSDYQISQSVIESIKGDVENYLCELAEALEVEMEDTNRYRQIQGLSPKRRITLSEYLSVSGNDLNANLDVLEEGGNGQSNSDTFLSEAGDSYYA